MYCSVTHGINKLIDGIHPLIDNTNRTQSCPIRNRADHDNPANPAAISLTDGCEDASDTAGALEFAAPRRRAETADAQKSLIMHRNSDATKNIAQKTKMTSPNKPKK